jgi:hypothetical protein
MWVRSLGAVSFAVWLFSLHAMAAEPCYCRHLVDAKQPASPANSPQFDPAQAGFGSDYTSFRGLSLSMSKSEARKVLRQLGFDLVDYESTVTAMHICSGQTGVGTARFDKRGKINKLELSPLYFAVSKMNVREFADRVFEHYKVRRSANTDDICFQDVTCFRGTTLVERVLILRISNDVQFHITPRPTGSDLTLR